METPSALSKIDPFPVSLINILREIAETRDPQAAVQRIVGADQTWSAEVESLTSHLSQTPIAGPASFNLGVCEIAIATSVHKYLSGALVAEELIRYWRYILACGLVCRDLFISLDERGALAFSCGLLHDLGRLALMAAYPLKYRELFIASERAFGRNELINVAVQERVLFGFDRFQTGELLVEKWALPDSLRQIVGKFQSPGDSTQIDIVSVTRVGCSLAYSLGYGLLLGAPRRSVQDLHSQLPFPVDHDLGEDFCLLRERTDASLKQLMALLG